MSDDKENLIKTATSNPLAFLSYTLMVLSMGATPSFLMDLIGKDEIVNSANKYTDKKISYVCKKWDLDIFALRRRLFEMSETEREAPTRNQRLAIDAMENQLDSMDVIVKQACEYE